MAKKYLPDKKSEKNRYNLHSSGIKDSGYLDFVSPVLKLVTQNLNPKAKGLDYGCGKDAVIAEFLTRKNWQIDKFDPFFFPSKLQVDASYDFIICVEVIEHFHNPAYEFGKLKALLKDKGKLLIMTDVITPETDFSSWYYKNDFTHVFFYATDALKWICRNFGFSSIDQQGRLIIFEK